MVSSFATWPAKAVVNAEGRSSWQCAEEYCLSQRGQASSTSNRLHPGPSRCGTAIETGRPRVFWSVRRLDSGHPAAPVRNCQAAPVHLSAQRLSVVAFVATTVFAAEKMGDGLNVRCKDLLEPVLGKSHWLIMIISQFTHSRALLYIIQQMDPSGAKGN